MKCAAVVMGLVLVAGVSRAGPCDAVQRAKIVPDERSANDQFGTSVALRGEIAAVGTPMDDGSGMDAGAVTVLRRTTGGWMNEGTLRAGDGAAGDQFGAAVGVAGDRVIVGAPMRAGAGVQSGAVYVFVRSGAVWVQEAVLAAPDAAAGDRFGSSIAGDGERIVVGAFLANHFGPDSGAAYVFRRTAGAWVLEAKLLPSDGAASDWFGFGVSMSGDRVAVGAYLDDDRGANSGSVYVFVREGGGWVQETKVTAPDGAASDWFGRAVSLEGDVMLVGSRGDDDRGAESGSAHVFRRAGGAWAHEAKLLAPDGAANDIFGTAVALAGNRAVVGSPNDGDQGAGSGSAYVFRHGAGGWLFEHKLHASDGGTGDQFASCAAAFGGRVLLGSPLDNAPGLLDVGSVFEFDLTPPLFGDANGDRAVDFGDVTAVLAVFGTDYSPGTGFGDADGNGAVDFADITAALGSFGAACP